MSEKSSTSPALRLRIADSRRALALQLALFLCILSALVLVARDGRPELAMLLALYLFCCLPRLLGQPWVGTVVAWRGGQWSLDRGQGEEPVELMGGCRVTPWAVLLCFRDGAGCAGRLWVLPDAVAADEWRRLRVRLRLEG